MPAVSLPVSAFLVPGELLRRTAVPLSEGHERSQRLLQGPAVSVLCPSAQPPGPPVNKYAAFSGQSRHDLGQEMTKSLGK